MLDTTPTLIPVTGPAPVLQTQATSTKGGGSPTLTMNMTISNNTGRVMVVTLGAWGPPPANVATATISWQPNTGPAQSFTLLASTANLTPTQVAMYYLVNPSYGTNGSGTITVSVPGEIAAVAGEFINASQDTNPFRSSTAQIGSSLNVSLANVTNTNEVAIDGLSDLGNFTDSPNSNQHLVGNIAIGNSSVSSSYASNASSVNWTRANGDNPTWAMVIGNIKPLITATPTPQVTPTPTQQPSPFGKALKLNGTAKIETPHDPSMAQDIREKAVRIETFITPTFDESSTGYIVYSQNEYGLGLNRIPGGQYYLNFWIADKKNNCQKSEYSQYVGVLPGWNYIVAQYQYNSSGSKVDIWLNGYKTTQQVNWGVMCVQTTNPPYDIYKEIYIGGSSANNENFKGYIDHVSISHATGTDGPVPQAPYTSLPIFGHALWHFDSNLEDADFNFNKNNGTAIGSIQYADSNPLNTYQYASEQQPSPTPTPTTRPNTTPTAIPPTVTTVPTVAPTPIPGDIDGVNGVTIVDFNIWHDEYTSLLSTKKSDLNKDGVLDLLDYSIWRNNYQP